MKKKNIIIFSVVLCMAVLFCIRFYIVNRDVKTAVIKEYEKGEIVPLGSDFNDSSDDSANGYTIQVLDSQYLPAEEFMEKYHLENKFTPDEKTEYYYVIKISAGNIDNEKGEENGLSMYFFSLTGIDYMALPDFGAFEVMNPHMPGPVFSLKPGTTMEFYVPYSINADFYPKYKHLPDTKPMLQLTEYPVRKKIKLY